MKDKTKDMDRKKLLQQAFLKIEELQKRLEKKSHRAVNDPLAVIGIGMRFPASVDSPELFWDFLVNQTDAVTEIPADRWDVDAFYDPDPEKAGKMYARHGAFLEKIDRFDASFFGITPREANKMDPQHRILLEVAWETLERAGHASESLLGSNTGVFISLNGDDYMNMINRNSGYESIDLYFGTGVNRSIAAGRISYSLGLKGPCVSLDTACSGSLVAIHLACQSLRMRECDMAVAGGINLMLLPDGFIGGSKGQMLSPDGCCKAFDASANGYVRGEGCAMVAIKRLSDAVTDNDNILAVIRGSAINQDGRSGGMTAPSGKAQEEVIRKALKDADLSPLEIGYVETHGTGTVLGDPIEVQALGSVYGSSRPMESPLLIGAVKTNVGHLEATAGIAGLIKAILILENGQIPPNLHYKTPNPHIPWSELPVSVVNKLTQWPVEKSKRIAAVSSFGFSGTNSHIIVESAPLIRPKKDRMARKANLLTLSAKTPKALEQLAGRFCSEIEKRPSLSMGDMCFSANCGRESHEHRLALVAEKTQSIKEALDAFLKGQPSPSLLKGHRAKRNPPKVGFLFTGQGVQKKNMGKLLFETQPVFRQAMERCNELAQPHLGTSLLSILYPDSENGDVQAELIHQTRYSQPVLFAFEYALAQMWLSWGVEPAFVMGHSVGEYVAACVAGVFSLEHGIRLVVERGRLMQALPGDGAMAAVFADIDRVQKALAQDGGTVSIAAHNSPENTVISGPADGVERIRKKMADSGIASKRLMVSHAFHSKLVESMVPDFRAIVDEMDLKRPRVELVSNVSGKLVDGDEIVHSDYWCRHILQPVLFRESINTLMDQDCTIFLEVGPHPTLVPMAQQCMGDSPTVCISSMRRGRDDWGQLLKAAGRLFVHGVDMDRAKLDMGFERRRIPLPTYPFQRERYWVKLPKMRSRDNAPAKEAHPILGHKIVSPKLTDHIWEKNIDTGIDTYLNDHRLLDQTIVPAAFYLEMAQAAAWEACGASPHQLEAFNIFEPLLVDSGDRPKLQVVVSDANGEAGRFEIFSLAERDGAGGNSWKLHASGRFRRTEEIDSVRSDKNARSDPRDAAAEEGKELTGDWYYHRLVASGVEYGPAFQGLRKIWRTDDAARARIVAPDKIRENCDQYHIHPAVLDTCFQLLGITLFNDENIERGGDVYMPMGLERYRVYHGAWKDAWAHATLRSGFSGRDEVIEGDIHILSDDGVVLAEIEGLRFKRATADALSHAQAEEISGWLYKTGWQDLDPPVPGGDTTGSSDLWLVLADQYGLGQKLCEGIRQRGGHARVVYPAETYEENPDGSTGINPLGAEDFAKLMESATDRGVRQIGGVVHLWNLIADADDMTLEHIDKAYDIGCLSLVHLIQALIESTPSHQPKLTVVTSGAVAIDETEAGSVQPPQTSVWGLGRVISAEYPQFESVLVDIDPSTPPMDWVLPVMEEMAADDRLENQIALRRNRRLGLRLLRHRVRHQDDDLIEKGAPYQWEIDERGVIENLRLRPAEVVPPDDGEVQIEIEATGQNFRDVLNALDMYPGDPGPLGNECVGRVSAIGKGVEGFSAGDPVLALTPQAFCSHVNAKAAMVVKRPRDLSVAAAATIPITFLTAEYALNHLGGMQAGERVLIHAAAGGVGMAALQLARQKGAEIYATAGSPEKRKFLRSLGIGHVMNSRNLDFAEQIMSSTDGQGIDIVLNSLAGDFITKSIQLLRGGGRFLELGKTDLRDAEKVQKMNPQASYQAVFLGDICKKDPDLVQSWFQKLMDGFRRRELKPLPVQLFPIADVVKAFRFMAQAKHTGKIVIDHRFLAEHFDIREDATYIITGGTGGLGLSFCKRLVERGAGRVILSARNISNPMVRQAMEPFLELGEQVTVCQADVAESDDVQRMLDAVDPRYPLKGIIHAAGIIEDASLLNQDRLLFKKVIRPKAHGSWLLHKMTRPMELDFFIMCSAGAALLGSPGQANYAAANAFMDGLAFARHGRGLPATSINWGPWDKVGMAAQLGRSRHRQWQSLGIGLIQPSMGALALERAFEMAGPQVAVLPMNWKQMSQNLKGTSPPSLIADFVHEAQADAIEKPASAGSSDFLARMKEVDAEDQYEMLLGHIRQQVAEALELGPNLKVSADQSLSDLGMDSLMAVEISNRLKQSLQCSLPSTVAFEYPTLNALAEFLSNEILDVSGPGVVENDSSGSQGVQEKVKEEVEGLSDDEVEESLLRELDDSGY